MRCNPEPHRRHLAAGNLKQDRIPIILALQERRRPRGLRDGDCWPSDHSPWVRGGRAGLLSFAWRGSWARRGRAECRCRRILRVFSFGGRNGSEQATGLAAEWSDGGPAGWTVFAQESHVHPSRPRPNTHQTSNGKHWELRSSRLVSLVRAGHRCPAGMLRCRPTHLNLKSCEGTKESRQKQFESKDADA